MVGWHRSHVGRIDAVGQVEQAARRGLLDEVVEDLVNDMFEVGEKAIDRVSRRRSIKPAAKPDERVLKLSCNGMDAVDVLIIAPMETLLPRRTTAIDKIVAPFRYLPLFWPMGGSNRHAVRSLSGGSSRSRRASLGWPLRAAGPAALRFFVYALTPGGSYTSPRSSIW